MKHKKTKKRVGKVNPLLYALVFIIFRLKYARKYRIKFDKKAVRTMKRPAIVVATHTCDMDHILSALTLYPIRPTYIVSEHFMHDPSKAKLLKLMHVITKKMFTPDVSTIINVMRAKKENAVIVIFPEGRLSCYGHTLPITDGTAELIKKLGVDLYSWRAEGAYLSFPKWRDKGDSRRGRINASVRKLLSAEEVEAMDVSAIRSITEEAILHDDELAMQGVVYKSRAIAKGVDKILFKCPRCLAEGTITARGDRIRCECGLDARLDSTYRLHGAPFDRINEWFEWAQNSIDTEHEVLESHARLGCCGGDGYMDPHAGEGNIYLDHSVFRLHGHLHGEPIDFEIEPTRIGAFPITPGDHFDIYHSGVLIYVYPEPDPRSTVKWICFLDKLVAESHALPAPDAK